MKRLLVDFSRQWMAAGFGVYNFKVTETHFLHRRVLYEKRVFTLSIRLSRERSVSLATFSTGHNFSFLFYGNGSNFDSQLLLISKLLSSRLI